MFETNTWVRSLMRYRVCMTSAETAKHNLLNVGLCLTCRHSRRVESTHGSAFYLCRRSATDATFPKYPHLPVTCCSGHEPREGERYSRS